MQKEKKNLKNVLLLGFELTISDSTAAWKISIGNLKIFLPHEFYVKSNLVILGSQKRHFDLFSSLDFRNIWEF